LYEGQFIMARTTFSGPVRSLNGFEGVFSSTSVQLQSDNANTITIDAPNALAASYTLVFPPNDGDSGQVLTTNGSGVTTWTTNGTGTVTSVGGTGTVNGLTLTGTVSSTGDLTLGGSFALGTSTAAAVGAIANAINTAGKYAGKMVVDYTTGIIYTAVGATAASAWAPSDASGLVTPA
jgi:hypothetical protein